MCIRDRHDACDLNAFKTRRISTLPPSSPRKLSSHARPPVRAGSQARRHLRASSDGITRHRSNIPT
eukprot:15239134-Alexandrium_andersonii.AAC.2